MWQAFVNAITKLASESGFANITYLNLVLISIALVFYI